MSVPNFAGIHEADVLIKNMSPSWLATRKVT